MSRKVFVFIILLSMITANTAVFSAGKIGGKDSYTKAEREKAAADGRKKKAATKTYVDTIYPKSGLTGSGEPWTISLGAIVGYALETDTAVYIDGKYVKSYAVGNMNAIDIDDLIPFGFTIKRDTKKKTITITRDAKAVKKEYDDQVDKSNVLVGKSLYTLVANNVRVKTMDKRAYTLTLSPSLPSFTTTTGKTLVPVEFFHIVTNNFSKQGNLAFVSYPANKKEISLHTLANEEVYYATGPSRRYWVANKYPDTEKSLLDGDEKKVLAKAQSILKSIIRPEMGEFDKELAIYDYLATYGAYDYSSYALNTGRPVDPEDPPANPEAYNVYGALVDALAVCEGWSDAYQLLFTLVGMKSETPIGSLRGEPHKWVSVQVDGDWYHIEATKKSEKGSASLYRSAFNFTYQDANDFLSYSGGDERAISQKYDYMNRMNRERNPDKSPFELEEEEAAAAAERAKVETRQATP